MRIGSVAAARLATLSHLSDRELADQRSAAALALRRRGTKAAEIIAGLAVAGEYGRRSLNLTPFTEQLACAAALATGSVVEMETGEGKTLAAFLAASVFGLAGRIVHVVTSNDYLAGRDCRDLAPAYAALRLSAGAIQNGDATTSRRAVYAGDIAYVSSKEVAFDFLRDGLARASSSGNFELVSKLDRALGASVPIARQMLQRGLDVAIVDEIDSVLIDEAVTPLLISTQRDGDISQDVARHALRLAADFRAGEDFALEPFDGVVALTARGLLRLERETASLTGPWRIRLVREELLRGAIAALHALVRDRHYLVREGKIALIDQQSGRLTPDRHWGHGLSLMVETKEGCASTGEKKSLASISFQRYFRNYGLTCGMSGTVREAARELYSVYGLTSVRVKRRLPLRRIHAKPVCFANREDLWRAVARLARDLQKRGQPALVAVRSVGEADRASAALSAAGVEHRVLSAAQDSAEAEIVARAGERGAITVVTNMAGRGTDIRLAPGVAELGGLAVLICERNESRRVDRQLIGRCARQGDRGLVHEFLSREDGVLHGLSPHWGLAIRLWSGSIGLAIRRAQTLSEARGLAARVQLLQRDEHLAKMMAFAGGLD
jgi:preprotein translocase subunit SecA